MEVDDAAAALATVTVKDPLLRIDLEARRVLTVQRAKAGPLLAVAAQLPTARPAIIEYGLPSIIALRYSSLIISVGSFCAGVC